MRTLRRHHQGLGIEGRNLCIKVQHRGYLPVRRYYHLSGADRQYEPGMNSLSRSLGLPRSVTAMHLIARPGSVICKERV
jgi:hypothetical protein